MAPGHSASKLSLHYPSSSVVARQPQRAEVILEAPDIETNYHYHIQRVNKFTSMVRSKKNLDFKNLRLPLLLNGKNNKDNVNAHCLDKKKALKHCIKKIRQIGDPDTKLHRAVLLNNTLQRIKQTTELSYNCHPTFQENNLKTSVQINETCVEDIFSEIVLPPSLNENHLEQLKIKSEDCDQERNIYYHSITNYHLEEEIYLFDSSRSCEGFIHSETLKRTQ